MVYTNQQASVRPSKTSACGGRIAYVPYQAEIQLLRPPHAPALLAFERENRACFAASTPRRGDDCFARFDERHRALLAEQAAGVCLFRALVGAEGEVWGRINLVDVADCGAELGCRIAQHAAGRGLATWAVREICGPAACRHGWPCRVPRPPSTTRHRVPP